MGEAAHPGYPAVEECGIYIAVPVHLAESEYSHIQSSLVKEAEVVCLGIHGHRVIMGAKVSSWRRNSPDEAGL